ncbi:MAG: T9SS type A sorting domain-containing protein, partial [Bacteroidota bacterium]|nr:T9SS type A sorting domain-containing protein [Bacteroidota bacterium]
QKINWNDYYPLEIGNFWKYSESWNSGMTYNEVVEVLSDSLLSDGHLYKTVRSTQNGPSPYPSYRWQRIDDLGNVFEWYGNNDIPKLKYHLSACVADTFVIPNRDGFWSIDKTFLENAPTLIVESQSIVYAKLYYSKGRGLFIYAYEGGIVGNLIGSIINGIHWGDTSPLGVEDGVNKLITYSISQNYPNPFNPATTISYQLPKNGQVTIKVYDMLGREVRTLVNENKPAGNYNVSFDAGSLSSGVYIYRIVAGDYTAAKKMTLIK